MGKMLSTASGFIKSSSRLMVLLIVTKRAWLLKVLSNGMVLTMRIHLVLLLNQLLFVWFCRLLFLVDGTFDS
jgi:hypothetical protein